MLVRLGLASLLGLGGVGLASFGSFRWLRAALVGSGMLDQLRVAQSLLSMLDQLPSMLRSWSSMLQRLWKLRATLSYPKLP